MSESHSSKGAKFEPVAIVGMAGMFPEAETLESFWANIKNGRDAITEIPDTHWRPKDYFDENQKTPDHTYGKRGGFLSRYAFDPLKYGIPPASLEATDATQLLGMVVAEAAMNDAGYGTDRDFDRDRVSVILGITGALELVIPLGARLGHPLWRKALREAGLREDVVDDLVQRIGEQYVGWQENSFPGLLGNVVAGRISKYLNTGGTNCVVDAACASSLSALEMAVMELGTGRADMAITGGADTFNDIFMYMCFSKTPALSPTGNAKPFDRNGDGTILGEGIGFVVLKRLADAERDNDRIYAVIKGVGSSSDGKGEAIYAPSSPGQMKALRAAYAQADIDPSTVELVEAHGTGTAKGDAVEVRALREVFGDPRETGSWCALGSIKSQIGHTKAAAGAAGLLKAAMALHHKVLPPTLKVNTPLDVVAPGASAFYVNTEKRPWLAAPDHPRRAGVSSFGFGGSNFHLVVEEYAAEKSAPDWDGDVQILAYSADNASGFDSALKQLDSLNDWSDIRDEAARSREAFKANAPCRLLVVCERDKTDLAKQAASARKLIENGATASSPDGVFVGVGKPDGKLAVLFPGQGAQYIGMQRDLACQFPEALDTLNAANETLREQLRLADLVYPHPAFDDETRKQQSAALQATDVAQPALGAASLGAWRVLQRFGIEANAFAGHSYGELTALAAAGRLTDDELFRLSRLRGELMAAGEGDRGSMLAVKAPLADIDAFLNESGLDLVLANRNAPDQGVLSGSTDAINGAYTQLRERKITCTKLPVAAAFHSELVAGAAQPFGEALAEAAMPSGSLPVYANTTGEPYPQSDTEARSLLANQLAKPVDFVREIESMHAAGVRTFVECGPGARLTGLVKSILNDREHTAIALDASNGKRSGIADLANTLAQISALGYAVNLREWDAAHKPAPPVTGKPRLLVEISGANYRSEASRPKKREPIAQPMPAPAPAASESKERVVERLSNQSSAATSAQTSPQPAASLPIGAAHELLRQTQQNIEALRQMQDQTAQLHRQYLEGQERATDAFHALLQQQQQLFSQISSGAPVAPAPQQSYVTQPVPAPATPPRQAAAPAERPAPAATEAQASAPAPAEPQQSSPALEAILLEVVGDKTGYPVEMLDLAMSLDADLGIDSIKRVEILSALQERIPELPSVAADELGDIQTLGDIVARFADVAPAAPAESTTPATAGRDWTALLLEVVAEKTGYPTDMLDLSMSLDADLGIDSIKRVEILSALQEQAPELPSVDAEVLGSLQTLDDVRNHLLNTAPAVEAAPAASAPSPQKAASALIDSLLDVIAEKTGYPVEMLEAGMNLEGDLGIDSIKRVEILSTMQEKHPELPTLEADALGALQTIQDVVDALAASDGPAPAPKPESRPVAANAAPPAPAKPEPTVAGSKILTRQVLRIKDIQPAAVREPFALRPDADIRVTDDGGILASAVVARLQELGYNATLVSLESRETYPNGLDALVIVAPVAGADASLLKHALFKAQSAAEALRRTGADGKALFATISRLDGAFGLKKMDAATAPVAGGLAGLAKTAAHEWPEVTCRAVDLAQRFDSVQQAAERCVEELLSVGPIEIGVAKNGSVTTELTKAPLGDGKLKAFTKRDVVLLTGGARGVTAEVARAIARHTRAKLVLLGRTSEPAAEPEWLAPLHDEAAIKRALIEHATQEMTPRELESEYSAIRSSREIRDTLASLKEFDTEARYISADVRDTNAVTAAIKSIRDTFGDVTAIVHGAGILADRRIEDKTPEQVDAVLGVKIRGLENLLNAIGDDSLTQIVLFSSSTGRFGRTGQVDYAMANEALNKIAQFESRQRKNCRVVSINWGPWAGGMVTPGLAKIFANEGVGLIDLEAGAELVLRELVDGSDSDREVVVLAETASAVPETSTHVEPSHTLPLQVSIERFPCLRGHVMDGKAVVPVALEIEWFAHAALHAQPGYKLHAIENLRVFKGIILDPNETRRIELIAGEPLREKDRVTVPVELRSGDLRYAAARVVLVTKLPDAQPAQPVGKLAPYGKTLHDIYEGGGLFHGESFQGIAEIEGVSSESIAVLAQTASLPKHWCAEPLRGKWCADPLALDCAFQAMILWSLHASGNPSLPVAFERYEQFVPAFPKGQVRIAARIEKRSDHNARSVIEFTAPDSGELLARIVGYECVIDPSLHAAFKRNEIAADPARS